MHNLRYDITSVYSPPRYSLNARLQCQPLSLSKRLDDVQSCITVIISSP